MIIRLVTHYLVSKIFELIMVIQSIVRLRNLRGCIEMHNSSLPDFFFGTLTTHSNVAIKYCYMLLIGKQTKDAFLESNIALLFLK